jgi:hypothetical protein
MDMHCTHFAKDTTLKYKKLFQLAQEQLLFIHKFIVTAEANQSCMHPLFCTLYRNFKGQFQWRQTVVATSVAGVRAPSNNSILTSPLHAPDKPLNLDLTNSILLGHKGLLQFEEAARLLTTLCCS